MFGIFGNVESEGILPKLKKMKPENWNPKSGNGKFLALQTIHLFRFQPSNLGEMYFPPALLREGREHT